MGFVHLHNHTDHSFLDGACKVTGLCEEAAKMGMPAVAITDHGNLCGAVDFYRAAKKAGIKPIIGSELYLTDGSRADRGKDIYGNRRPIYHLLVIAKNEAGWKNLMKLSSAGYLEGFYHRPRIDYELLERHSEGLICLSGCIQSHINQTLLNKGEKEAMELAGRFKEWFGEDFYLELQNHGIEEEEIFTRHHIELAKKIGVKTVATNDTHYLKKEHATPHDILLCVKTKSDLNEKNRFQFEGREYYLKSEAELAELFKEVPESLNNTLEVAEKVELEIKFDQKLFPKYPMPVDAGTDDYDVFLRGLCEAGLPKRYAEVTEEISDRLETELRIIGEKQLASYLLIVRDFIEHAKSEGIPVGPGRGSAAGSLVSYLIGITNIDPIHYGLLFERFINPERESYPDIDVDFADSRRSEVIEYVREKYGRDKVCQIITFNRMLSRQVVKDVGRVMGVPLSEVESITKLIPEPVQGKTIPLSRALDEVRELKELVDSGAEYKQLIENALILEGTIRDPSIHAAGVVITPRTLTDHVPLYKSSDGEITTQFEMNVVEKIGLLKVDFLGLKTLTIIEKTLELIRKRGVEISLEAIPLDDRETFELFSRGDTIGIFQFESGGMRNSLRRLKPERLEDLIAMNALYRPGPMENVDDFIARRHGKQKISYLRPMLGEILDETYGIIVYQEQVMKIANILSGMSLGRADVLRKAMGKKKKKLMAELMPEFIEGCRANGIEEKTAKELWDLIERFAQYGFNKSHAAGYALLAYQTGYLKTHYPSEFFAASLTIRKDRTEEMVLFLEECSRMKIEVLPPDVNESEEEFAVTPDGKVRFGLGAVKNVGSGAIQNILGSRDTFGRFTDIFDLVANLDGRLVNRKALENLILAGAADSLKGHRAQQVKVLDQAIAYARQIQEERARGQVSIFGDEEGAVTLPRPELPEILEMSAREQLAGERERLGFYFSGHPLLRCKREVEAISSMCIADMNESGENQNLRIAGIICSIEKRTTRKGDLMGRGRFEDLTGIVNFIVFPRSYEQLTERLVGDVPVVITGRMQKREERAEIIVEGVEPLEEATARLTRGVELIVSEDTSGKAMLGLEEQLRKHPGKSAVRFVFQTGNGERFELASHRYSVDPARELFDEAETLLGDGTVRLEIVG